MMSFSMSSLRPVLLLGASALALSGCIGNGNFDADLRGYSGIGFDTAAAARQATAARPAPDARGVISYPNYQVAVAQAGDTVATVATRVGANPGEVARYNALSPDTRLGKGEILALPRRVSEPVAPPSAAVGGERIDVTTLASGAIDRAQAGAKPAATAAAAPVAPKAAEPIRHKVARGETAYSIARYYNVSPRALTDWNGLPADLSVREGQFLMIPVAETTRTAAAPGSTAPVTTAPGQGSPTPTPPSAAKPLPAETPPPAAAAVKTPPAADMGANRTAATNTARMQMPVSGPIIRPYVKKKNDGIDISAKPGTVVKAAAAGTVAAITKDTEQVPILVIRHDNNLLTVYANIDAITVAKGARVGRGDAIAKVRAGDPGFLHFEVREGFESVDPMPFLQ